MTSFAQTDGQMQWMSTITVIECRNCDITLIKYQTQG